jgi:hypothetical protein
MDIAAGSIEIIRISHHSSTGVELPLVARCRKISILEVVDDMDSREPVWGILGRAPSLI